MTDPEPTPERRTWRSRMWWLKEPPPPSPARRVFWFLLSLLVLPLGVMLLWTAAQEGTRNLRMTAKAEGEVVMAAPVGKGWQAIFRFTLPDGRTVHAQDNYTGTRWASLGGSRRTVRYDPVRPEDGVTSTFFGRYMRVLFPGLWGAVCVWSAVSVMVTSIRGR